MKLNSCLLASILMLSSSTLLADVSIPYGEGSGKVDFLNYKKYPRLEDPYPTGPLCFRVVGDKIWVADSIGNKLLQYGKDGKLISEFSVLPEGEKPYKIGKFDVPLLNMRIEDFAPVLGNNGELTAFWVVDFCSRKLFKFSPDGKKLDEITNPEFKQPFRVEVGLGGHLFIADKMTQAIFTYDVEGNLLNKQHWEWSGMAVAGKKDYLYRLMYDNEARKNLLIKSNTKGKIKKEVMLDVTMFNPKLWWVDEEKGECVITYSPAEFKGFYNIVRVGLDGKVRASGELPAPIIMNRYIDSSNHNEVFIGKGNFFNAPEGSFEVVPFKLP